MDNLKMISIIVPIYNVEKYLDKCLESIVNQTYKNIEIILVNNGSTDNSLTIAKQWKNKDSRIKVFSIE
ncbi:glycosyltransferase family 2 protein, partial [Thomasclavelia cocleata]